MDGGGSRMLAGGAAGQRPGGTGGSGGGGDGGSGGDGGCFGSCSDAAPPSDIPSRQTVTFELSNQTGADRFVVTQGWYCDDFGIASGPGGAALPLELGFQCLCECPNPGPVQATAYHRVAPGASYRLTWDARSLVTWSELYDCATHGWPGVPPQNEVFGAHQPVGAGPYRVTFAIEQTLPSRCSPTSGDDYTCTMEQPPIGMWPTTIAQICPSLAPQTVGFTLPQSGDLSLPVALQ
jgi:hypothetical protein